VRIGLVIERMVPGLGGAEQWTYQFARWLVDEQHEVHLVAQEVDPCIAELGVDFHCLETCRNRLDFAELAQQTTSRLDLDVVHDMGRGWNCDVFHPHNGSRSAAFEHNLLMEPAWKRPLKRIGQRMLPRYREFERLMARQYQSDNRIYVAVSEMVAGHFQRYHGIAENRIRQIYNGVDLERFTPQGQADSRCETRQRLGVRDDEVLLLLVAHNLRLKGMRTLLHACAALLREQYPVRLAVVGGKRFGRYSRMAKQLGIADRVTMIGAVQDTVPYYAAADVYVQPTYYDPCSLVVLEAMACKLPVVTTRFNGVAELMSHGVDGQLFDDPSDWRELTESLRPLMDAQRRRVMGSAARQLAEAHPLERNFAQIVDVYREVQPERHILRADFARTAAKQRLKAA
jgi:UDP-glucose:(heptosyl)LPS alpha-1,3-glucosyltransferase